MVSAPGFWVDEIYPATWFEEVNITENLTDTTSSISENFNGDYYYRVKAMDLAGYSGEWSNIRNVKITDNPVSIGPDEFSIEQGFSNLQISPNPFSESITIKYDLQLDAKVEIKIFNILGDAVKMLTNESQSPGKQTIIWDGTDASGKEVAPGIYFINIIIGNEAVARRILKTSQY
ncbi:MAG: T9SS type A sorting domain-containing protein [Bacteroidales bacterium]|nr:T9SS type A sorting domain-containing protein [Bacteroidales bacterium]